MTSIPAVAALPRSRTTAGVRMRMLSLAILVGATLVVFWPTLHNGFLPLGFDDALITDTQALRAPTWPNLWSLVSQFNHAHYVPLSLLSFVVDYRLWGFEPMGYHLTNVLLHALTATLLCVFLWSLVPSAPVALWAALIFALHPVQMEAVSVAVQRKTLLSGVFFFLTLILYQRWTRQRRPLWYVLSWLAFVAAALAKPSVATLPLLLLLYDAAFVGGRLRWVDKLPFLAVSAAVTVAAMAAHAAVGALHPLHGGSLLAHLLMVSRVLFEYVTALFLPLYLAPIYYYPHAIVYSPPNFVALLLIPLVCTYVTVHRHRYRWSCFCLWWFLLMWLPESNLMPLAQLRADRFLYLPMAAFALWAAVGLGQLEDTPRLIGRWPVRLVAPVLVGVLATLTARSATVWHDDVSAWTRVVERHPWCATAYTMLGRAYYDNHDYGNAEQQLTAATRLQAGLPDSHLYLAKVYAERGASALAEAQVQRFLELAPRDPEGLELLAALRQANGS